MKPKRRQEESSQLFQQDLEHLLDQRQPLYKLANRIAWEQYEAEFEKYYADVGRPGLPVRLMVGLLMLKQLENLSDERVCDAWRRDPYMQYFCGEKYFQWKMPCEPSELVHFRNRIGEKGVETILRMSIDLHGDKVKREDEVVVDTTVQEADIQFPTDTRLYVKCIEKLWDMGKKAGVCWQRSYVRTVPKELAILRTRSNRLVKQRRKARRRVKTIAGRLKRDFEGQLSDSEHELYREDLILIERVLKQKRHDKNKVYSLHDSGVLCIAKGKAHVKYEFGRKASVGMLRDSGVIVSATSFKENLYDGDTLSAAMEQAFDLTGKTFTTALVDRGYRGRRYAGETKVEIPKSPRKSLSYYERGKVRKRNGRRAAVEPVIGHLKSDYRMKRCFLKGAFGAAVNVALAAAAWNLKMAIREILFVRIWSILRSGLKVALQPWMKKTAFCGAFCAF